MDVLDKWDPEFDDVGTLSLDEIYEELSRLDAFERFISSKQGKDDTNAKKDSEQAPAQDNPEEIRKNTVLNDIDTRRIALRAGAMELSRAKIRPMTIVDLPADILLQIFGYFQDTRIRRQAQIDWGLLPSEQEIARRTARETIRHVRLVCSLFNDLASPLLCPILRVDLDQESLNGAVELCKRPRIAQGVHAIQVGLQYRPKELVSDCPKFKDFRKKQLQEMANRCDYYAEKWFLGGHESDDETVCPLPLRVYREATSNYGKISWSWDSYFDSDESDENDKTDHVAESEADEHMEILVRGYTEYRKKHEEQLQLITTGSFVTTVASCISQLPSMVALGFTDKMERLFDWNNPTVVLRDKSLLPGMLSAALEWQKIEDFGDFKLAPARILLELPVAIHKAGVKLRDLFIGPFPCRGSFSLLCPDTMSSSTDPTAWSDLRAACSSLRRVDFGSCLNHRSIRHEHLRPEEKYYVNQYLNTILCSAGLEDVRMSFYPFGLNDGRTTKVGWYDLGPVLAAVKWPRIKHLAILDVSSKQDDLQRFCSGLSDTMSSLQLSSIQLLNGSWAGILATLDEKVGYRFREQKATGYLSYLRGEEFEEEEVRERRIFEDFDSGWDEPEPLPPAGQQLKELHPSLFTNW
ncbi:hypothetical protein Aspvir_008086 [Aspergillus viridinutans]|uniref:F-box domain-containing protein n=1 Tax=Aspergillus viridinutans TaxID=75553 RepID=A0A9P3C2I9_ASPVI|nr:uncharacterized protein Aspvir_008086 [Aspergillus viridinutans]GIK04011.1 hypothetical protein Aspvir_008086 [Aspergillus viridinutans]